MSHPDPIILKFPTPETAPDPVVITGIGLNASLGSSREEVWQAIQAGRSGIRSLGPSDPVGGLEIPAAMVDWLSPEKNQLKSIQLTRLVAKEALEDAAIDWSQIDRNRFGCSISAQFGDIRYLYEDSNRRDSNPQDPWWNQFLPCTAPSEIASEHELFGPRVCHTTACASGLVSMMAGMRMIQDDQADLMLCGAADAIHEMVIAAFHRMGVLSTGPEPESACRPFDQTRSGFVMGEGAALLVLEKRSHAVARGAKIYAEIASSMSLGQAHHVTGLDGDSAALEYLIESLVHKAGWAETGPEYINAHGTGTEQNDFTELSAIRAALGPQADNLCMSSNKSMIGHLINAAGSVELALTALSLRDGYAPPTMHLKSPEAVGALDCLPMAGQKQLFDRALKLSLAFGGHLVGMALQHTSLEAYRREARPLCRAARIRESQPQVAARAA